MSFILPKEPQGRDIRPFVIVCEGMGDCTFVNHLLKHLAIADCCVGCPSDKTGGGQGWEKIPAYLSGIRTLTKDRNILSGIAVIADANRSLQKKFKVIKKGFQDAQFPKPKSPYSIVSAHAPHPRIGLYFIPRKGKSGTLEHLLLEAAFKQRPALERCVDQFSICARTKVGNWKSNERAKMKLSALVSVSCRKNPWASSNTMWGDKGCPVPINSGCFQEIKQFLSDFTKP
jgi:hypothetical protein